MREAPYPRGEQPSVSPAGSDKTKTLTIEEELTLARLIGQGDVKATIRLYEYHLDGVYRYFHRRINDISEVEDRTSETFCRAWEGLRDGTWPGQPFRYWLYGIARHVYFAWLREKTQKSVPLQLPPAREVEELLDEMLVQEQESALWSLVKRLPIAHQQVLILRYTYAFSYAEIAKRMIRSADACKVLHSRALQKLRELVQQENLWEELGIITIKSERT